MDLLRGLGGFLGGPGGFLGRLETNLRGKLAPRWIWEPSWGGLEGFLGRLEAKLRAKMVPSWVPRRRFWGIQKRSENGCIIGTLLGSTFSWILDRFWEAKWNQVGIKMECNIDRAVIAENLKII